MIFNPAIWITGPSVTLVTLLWVYFLASSAISSEIHVCCILLVSSVCIKTSKRWLSLKTSLHSKLTIYRFSVDNAGPSEYSERL